MRTIRTHATHEIDARPEAVYAVLADYRAGPPPLYPNPTLKRSKTGAATTFTVDPPDGGKHARVTIATEARASPGLRGLVERLVSPGVLRGLYHQELRQLEEYVKETTS